METEREVRYFVVRVEVSIAGQVVTTGTPAHSQRKQSARHLACLAWLKAYVSDELLSPAPHQPSELPAIAAAQSEDAALPHITAPAAHPTLNNPLDGEQNFVGLLQELSQSVGWELPTYQFTEAGSDFICTCTVLAQAQSFIAPGAAAQKKKAKQVAAKEMLVQLQRWFRDGERVAVDELVPVAADTVKAQADQASQPGSGSASIAHPILKKELKDGQNFIGFLQQLCQTLRWELPRYEFEGETPEFICTCSVWVEGQRFRGRAISSQKKAKYFAAKVVLLNLQQHF